MALVLLAMRVCVCVLLRAHVDLHASLDSVACTCGVNQEMYEEHYNGSLQTATGSGARGRHRSPQLPVVVYPEPRSALFRPRSLLSFCQLQLSLWPLCPPGPSSAPIGSVHVVMNFCIAVMASTNKIVLARTGYSPFVQRKNYTTTCLYCKKKRKDSSWPRKLIGARICRRKRNCVPLHLRWHTHVSASPNRSLRPSHTHARAHIQRHTMCNPPPPNSAHLAFRPPPPPHARRSLRTQPSTCRRCS